MSWKKIGLLIGGVAVLAVFAATGYALKNAQNGKGNEVSGESASSTALMFEEAGSSNEAASNINGESWPGELVSFSTVDTHPLSEGIITEVSVRVGQSVAKGQTIGLLSAPPASVEQAMASADKMQMLIKARTNADTMEKLAKEQIAYLMQTKQSIAPVRDSDIAVADREVDYKRQLQSNASADYERMKKELDASVGLAVKERDSAKVKIRSMERSLRTLLEQTVEKNLKSFTRNNGDYRFLLQYWSVRYKSTVANQERTDYENALSQLVRKLETSQGDGFDDIALQYVRALRNYTLTLQAGEDMMSADVAEAQNMAREQEKMIVDMVNDLHGMEAELSEKEAELQKMSAMRDSKLTEAKQMITTSGIEADQSGLQRTKMTEEAKLMYLERKKEIDEKISMLKRELEMARSEVRAAESAYDTFVGQLASQRIVAQRSGIISGIYKNVGDFVMPKDTIVSLTTGERNDGFVRFRMPSDAASLQAGDEVVVSRPGFPFDTKKAIVTGVGTALSEQGAYVAEAEFDEQPDWPVKSLVRVSRSEATHSLLVPFAAVKWDEEKQAHLIVADKSGAASDRIVKVGRAIGDKIEITEGLMHGERYAVSYDSTGTMRIAPSSESDGEEEGHGGGHQHGE